MGQALHGSAMEWRATANPQPIIGQTNQIGPGPRIHAPNGSRAARRCWVTVATTVTHIKYDPKTSHSVRFDENLSCPQIGRSADPRLIDEV